MWVFEIFQKFGLASKTDEWGLRTQAPPILRFLSIKRLLNGPSLEGCLVVVLDYFDCDVLCKCVT